MKSKILLTNALPYANGSIHLGHLLENIQTDIYARFLKLSGEDVLYCCADDAHGTAIEIKASEEKIDPEEWIKGVNEEHRRDFAKFHIAYDNYYSTHSEENRALSSLIFQKCKEKGLIYTKEIEMFYDEKAKRFLPDRYIKGECPKCHAQDQYGDACESCGTTYKPTDLINPYSTLSKTHPVRKSSLHYFFKLSVMADRLREYFDQRNFQQEVVNYLKNWLDEGLQDWDISRDGPYFGFNIPGEEDKYFYVWMDAPIGYFASCKNYCDRNGLDAEEYFHGKSKIYHVIGKDIMYFHFLFWPAMLMAADFHVPDDILVHGFLTVDGKKMSKSRGTFLLASDFAEMYTPEYLRYYYAKMLSRKLSDIDLDFDLFIDLINADLVGNIGNFCYRSMLFAQKNFQGKIIDFNEDDYPVLKEIMEKIDLIKEHYSTFNFNKAMYSIQEISSLGNKFFNDSAPWTLKKEGKMEEAQRICSVCCRIAQILSVLISPVLPVTSEKLRKQLGVSELEWELIYEKRKDYNLENPEILVKKIEEKVLLKTNVPETREIQLHVDPKLDAMGMRVCIAQVNGVEVKRKHEGLEKLKKQTVAKLEENAEEQKKTLEKFKAFYKKIETDPMQPAEHLHSLIQEKKLPQINTVVDSYNIVSAKTMLAMGAHDLNKIQGDIHLRFAKKSDRYAELGSNQTVKIDKNEFVYVDDKFNVLCRMNTKQGNATNVDNDTQNVVLVVDGFDLGEVRKAAEEVCKNIVKFCGGKYSIQAHKPVFPLHLIVAEIVEAENHPDSDKLILLQVDLKTEKRQIVAGIRDSYNAEDLPGKKVVVVSNLKPAKLRGKKSNGMLLAASGKETKCTLLEAPEANPGDVVTCGDMKNYTERIKVDIVSEIVMEVKDKKVLVSNFSKELQVNGKKLSIDVPDGFTLR